MADYPPTPPFGIALNRVAPHYHEAAHHAMHSYDDVEQSEPKSALAWHSGRGSIMEYHAAQTRAAFEQNAKINGFGAASVTPGLPLLPMYRGQENLIHDYQAATYGLDGTSESSKGQNAYARPWNPSPKDVEQDKSHAQNRRHPSLRIQDDLNVEEGELSEGEYEEVRPNVNRNTTERNVRHDYYEPQREDRHRPLYDQAYVGNGERPMTPTAPLIDMYGRSLDLNPHRSDSYSPYEPPNEIEYEPHPAQEVFAPHRQLTYHEEHEPPEVLSNLQRARHGDVHSELLRVGSHRLLGNAASKSLHDARKEAQNAILNLLPLKVRFQDYLDEGIDREVIRRQFESLGVPLALSEMSLNKQVDTGTIDGPSIQSHSTRARDVPHGENHTPSSPQASKVSRGPHANASLPDNLALSKNNASQVNVDGDRALENLNPVESRKDRIARLLAEKKWKQSSPVVQSDSPAASASPEASTPNKPITASQPAAKADKERQLRQKMEALQKSREQRAQKAAAKIATLVPTITAEIGEIDAQKSTGESTRQNQQPSEPRRLRSTSPVPIVSKQIIPSIPGLFLASEPSAQQTSADHTMSANTIQNNTQRKRPVASDFDRPSSAASSHKLPFGQSRNDQPLVIDVSDDGSGDEYYSEMEVDPLEPFTSGNHLQIGMSNVKAKAVRDLPPLSDFPLRKPFPTASSTMGTPPTSQTSKAPISKPEDLHRKELEIQEMRRKIAEAERRKKAKQNSSGSQTPRLMDTTSSPAINNGVGLADKIEASVQIEHLMEDASRQVDLDQQKLTLAHVEERTKEDELKRSEAERRRLRRAEIASNLPVVDAEVEKAQKQLADLRAEMSRIEAAVRKGMDDKRRLAEEMERLGQEAEEQLQVQKDKLQELTLDEASDAKVEENVDATIVSVQRAPDQGAKQAIQPHIDCDVLEEASVSRPPSNEVLEKSAALEYVLPIESTPGQVSGQNEDRSPPNIGPDQALEAALQEATLQADNQSDGGLAMDVEMADSFAPDPEVLAPASEEDSSESNQHDQGLIESSEEPMDVADGDSDIYEPPEATPPPTDAYLALNSPPFSPAPPDAMHGSAHVGRHSGDISTGSNDVLASKAAINQNNVALPPATADLENSLLANQKTFYTPYESPLRNFRAFRFHPFFEEEVQGGFKSITYSNNIKDGTELCRFELAGGVCNDASCEFQHFRDMGLADDAILVELGNSAGYSEEDKPRFVAGLRTVLQGLRAKKTKDFHVIASEIAAYRARFLGDQSKILLLEESST